MKRLFHALCVNLLVFAGAAAQEPRPSAEQAWQRLKDGNERFVANRPAAPKHAERRAETARGQKPFAIILACADSRTGPELVFDQGVGDLFVVRVAGNVTDPVVLGSIEYAVAHLHAPLIVVLGHEKCGAVAAAVQGGHAEGNVAELLKHVHVGKDLPKGEKAAVARAVLDNALYQAAEMTRQSGLLRDFARSGRVRIVTGIYDLESGRVTWPAPPARPGARSAQP